jgi:hypothetical protein
VHQGPLQLHTAASAVPTPREESFVKDPDQAFDEIADAVHNAEERAFHLDDNDYVAHEKETFDKLSDGVVGYEHPGSAD